MLASCQTVSEALCVCVCSPLQASWERRILKSLNSMCTELGVPLARKVPACLPVVHNSSQVEHLEKQHLSVYSLSEVSLTLYSNHTGLFNLGLAGLFALAYCFTDS